MKRFIITRESLRESYHFLIAVWSTKSLDSCLPGTARYRLALSLPAAINRPLTFFPLGKNCEGFIRKQIINQKKD